MTYVSRESYDRITDQWLIVQPKLETVVLTSRSPLPHVLVSLFDLTFFFFFLVESRLGRHGWNSKQDFPWVTPVRGPCSAGL